MWKLFNSDSRLSFRSKVMDCISAFQIVLCQLQGFRPPNVCTGPVIEKEQLHWFGINMYQHVSTQIAEVGFSALCLQSRGDKIHHLPIKHHFGHVWIKHQLSTSYGKDMEKKPPFWIATSSKPGRRALPCGLGRPCGVSEHHLPARRFGRKIRLSAISMADTTWYLMICHISWYFMIQSHSSLFLFLMARGSATWSSKRQANLRACAAAVRRMQWRSQDGRPSGYERPRILQGSPSAFLGDCPFGGHPPLRLRV